MTTKVSLDDWPVLIQEARNNREEIHMSIENTLFHIFCWADSTPMLMFEEQGHNYLNIRKMACILARHAAQFDFDEQAVNDYLKSKPPTIAFSYWHFFREITQASEHTKKILRKGRTSQRQNLLVSHLVYAFQILVAIQNQGGYK